jgi:GNAT acetyltransferase-like protein
MAVYQLDPLSDARWDELINRHPSASIFHTRGWLKALRDCYGYVPSVLSTTEPGRSLANGLVFCKVTSWLTGSRFVSLPFSDHCQPLVDNPEELAEILTFLESAVKGGGGRYLEIRPLLGLGCKTDLGQDDHHCIHRLDLRPDLDSIYHRFHKSCIQRKLLRAERENLKIEEGRSERLLRQFYQLLIMTRRRHRLPPQPLEWFRTLVGCLGDHAVIRVTSKDGEPLAGIFTLTYGKTLFYKYGASNAQYHNLGGMPSLFWHAIQQSKSQGLQELDLGRSERADSGLVAFKEHWGAARAPIVYYRYPNWPAKDVKNRRLELAQQALGYLPNSCLTLIGSLLYRHMG